MTTDNDMRLRFGYRVPDGVTAAWGARLIVTQDGDVDLVYDRQDAVGPDAERRALVDYLNGTVNGEWKGALSALLSHGVVNTRRAKEVIVYDDDRMRIEGNSNASGGYFYVVAYFK